MCEMMLEKGIVVDDVAKMVQELEALTNKKIQDANVIKKFICSEKNTKFYIDQKLKVSVNQDTGSLYLWLDTGFYDTSNKPIFISLLRNCGMYTGHYVGTAKYFMECIKGYFPGNKKHIKENYSRFLQKYDAKIKEREVLHIEDESNYFLAKANCDVAEENCLSKIIQGLNVSWEKDPEPEVEEIAETVVEETLTAVEEEMTIGLLYDQLIEREQYIEKLLGIIERNEVQSKEQISSLKAENDAYKQAILRMRLFNEVENAATLEAKAMKNSKNENHFGHELLGRNKQILVLGDARLGIEDMQGIAKKDYGFEKNDLVFETDYDKVVHAADRVQNSGKYAAIIFGCCPHKVKNNSWTSIIDQFKNCANGIIAIDARTKNGVLKVTKESYRKALNAICDNLYLTSTAIV